MTLAHTCYGRRNGVKKVERAVAETGKPGTAHDQKITDTGLQRGCVLTAAIRTHGKATAAN